MRTIRSKLIIAIVEDSAIPRMLLARAMEQRENMELRYIAESGAQLLNILKWCEELPDVCILDLHMEGMSGSEVAYRIKEIYPFLLMIGFTSSANINEIQEMMDSGMTVVFSKDVAGMTEMLNWISNHAINSI